MKFQQILKAIQGYQKPFDFPEVKEIQNYLLSAVEGEAVYNADELYDISLALEPRVPDNVNSTLTKLQKTGLI